MKQNQYSRRTGEIAREKLASILLFQMADPALSLVTVTGVEVSVDRSLLRAYVSCERERYDEVAAALERGKGRIRSLLGRALGWRVTPELDFRIDTTTDEAERIARALEDVPPTIWVEKDEDGYPLAWAAEGAAGDGGDADAQGAEPVAAGGAEPGDAPGAGTGAGAAPVSPDGAPVSPATGDADADAPGPDDGPQA